MPKNMHLGSVLLQVLGRADDSAQDYWDGNWLYVAITFPSNKGRLKISGPYIHLPELVEWRRQLRRLLRYRQGTAVLNCMEPNFSAEGRCEGDAMFVIEMKIDPEGGETPFVISESMSVSALNELLEQLDAVCNTYEVRGTP